MSFSDRTLTCADCNATFTFTVSEQEFYANKGFTSDPRRCQDCRAARKRSRGEGGGGYSGGGGGYSGGGDRGGYRREERVMHDAVCAECGKNTQVPFVPTGSRPVYCSDCFRQQGGGGDSRGGGGRSSQRSNRW